MKRRPGNLQIRERLVQDYLPLVHRHAQQFQRLNSAVADLSDLVAVGTIGLMQAIDAFDVDRGLKFETFAGTRIRGSILDELRRLDWVPRSVRSKTNRLTSTRRELLQRLGRISTHTELAHAIGITEDQLDSWLKECDKANWMRLDDQEGAGDALRSTTLQDHRETDPSRVTVIRDLVEYCLQHLDDQQQLVVTLYYYEGLTMNEIGQVIGVSRSRITQIHTEIVSQIQHRLFHLPESDEKQ